MARCWCVGWIGVWLAGLLAGCAPLDLRAWQASQTAETAEFRRKLTESGWRFRPEWTPLVELPEYPRAADELPVRWTHPLLVEVVQDETRLEHGFVAACGTYADPSPGEKLAAVDGNDFAGWNAGVMLGQRMAVNPETRTAAELAARLERIVTRSLTYRPGPNEEWQPLPRTLRAAAAEAWCRALASVEGDAERVFAAPGRMIDQADVPVEIRGELLRGISRRVPPRRIPALVAALRLRESASESDATVLRRAAIDACVLHAVHHRPAAGKVSRSQFPENDAAAWETGIGEDSAWPADVWNLRHDADPYVRSRFAALLAVTRDPQALEVLQEQVRDTDSQVVREALVSLGALGGPAARDVLRTYSERSQERLAQAAVVGLAFYGPDALSGPAAHASGRVRGEVARRLAKFPDESALRTLRPMFTDSQIQVQEAAVATLEAWPDPLGSRGLLQAMTESPTIRMRKLAHRELERRHLTLPFPIDAEPATRVMAASALAERLRLPAGSEAEPEHAGTAEERLNRLRVAELAERLDAWQESRTGDEKARAAEWFSQLTEQDVPHLESLFDRLEGNQIGFLRSMVLPRLHPAYAALSNLGQHVPLADRQRAARDLQQLAAERLLPSPVVRWLQPMLPNEPDPAVWRAVMAAVLRDHRPEAAAIAQLALHGAWPDVRTLGCDYVAHHAQPEQATWVMPLFTDSNPAVQLAAIRAAGRCRNPLVLDAWTPPGGAAPLPGLRSLLDESRSEFRVHLVAAMSRLGDDAAQRELLRLMHDRTPAIRAAAAAAMAETGQSRFVQPLIAAAWTELHPQVRAAQLASLKSLVPVDQQPPALDQARSPAEAAEAWNTWGAP